MRSKNILILHASVGAGHARAAEAVAAALALEAPEARAVVVDVLDLSRPSFKRAYGRGYLELVDKAPALFGLLFEATNRPPRGRASGDRLRRALQRWGARGLPDLLEWGSWDAVVNTHFLPPEIIAGLRRQGRFRAPQLTVVTDYDAHRVWVHDPCELYCVASPAAAASLRGRGVPAARIDMTGIPVAPAFSAPIDRITARRGLGLPLDRPVIALSSGGHGVGPIEENFRALLAARTPAHIVAVCGRNERVRRTLSSVAPPRRHRVDILGFTERMPELMAAADLLVTKPGGLTTSEALACGLPMALVHPIPGQEERNAAHLAENGAAVNIRTPAMLTAAVENLLSSGPRLAEMRRRAKELGRPRAAFAVARQALALARGAANADTTLAAATVPALISHWAIPGLQTKAVTAPEPATAK